MAQFGSALDWGSRGRGFKSRQPDRQSGSVFRSCFFILRAFLREVLRPIDGNNSHSFLRQKQLEHSDEP